MACMNRLSSHRIGTYWRLAVWGLRVMAPGLAIVAIGLVALPWSTGTAQSLLAVGMAIYLAGVAITVVGIVLVYREAPRPRPNLIWLRWSLLHDAVHSRSASTQWWVEGADDPDRHRAQSAGVEAVRRSAHWRPAVWGLRMMGPGLFLVVAGLISLLWWTPAGRVIVAVGIGIYLIGLVISFVEVRRALAGVQAPRPTYARVQQTLLHDALHARS